MSTTYTIPAGNQYMDATLYTGNNANSRLIQNAAGFQPDFVWIKDRTSAYNNNLYDSVRTAPSEISSNLTTAATAGDLTAFNTNGFTINQTAGYNINVTGDNYVAWNWKAGGTAVTNTAGSITTNVSVNTTAGFSIIKYTGNGSTGTVGHGLGVAPQLVIVRRYNAALDWVTWHTSIPIAAHLYLNLTDASATNTDYFNSTLPTSSVISLGTDNGVNGTAYTNICYAWAPVPGYSQFGSYTGNGSANGPFVYTGFRPKFWMVKNTTTAAGWLIFDTSRDTYNVAGQYLQANASSAEGTFASVDLLSNGFKIRTTDNSSNTSGNVYI